MPDIYVNIGGRGGFGLDYTDARIWYTYRRARWSDYSYGPGASVGPEWRRVPPLYLRLCGVRLPE